MNQKIAKYHPRCILCQPRFRADMFSLVSGKAETIPGKQMNVSFDALAKWNTN
jgi:hypothetical protein